MDQAPVCSADSHVNEPPEAWERIPKDLRVRGPHFVQDPPGKKGLYLQFQGHEPDPVGMTFTAGKGRASGVIKKTIEEFTWDQWRGPWDPSARISDMDMDGVRIEVLYPSMGRNLYSLKGDETPLQLAAIQSYNDWLVDYCAVDRHRLIGLGLLSVLDLPWSIKEMERCAKLGLKGVMLPAGLPEGMNFADRDFEPLWAAAEGTRMPINFHINIVQGADRQVSRAKAVTLLQTGHRAMRRAIMEPLSLLTDLVFGRVLDNHPTLPFVLAEYDLSWVLPFMAKMDSGMRRALAENPDAPRVKTMPSEAVRRQVYITFQEDPAGLAGAAAIGMLENCLWASDYPHGGSSWPNSREVIASQLKAYTPAQTHNLLWGNSARIYGL